MVDFDSPTFDLGADDATEEQMGGLRRSRGAAIARKALDQLDESEQASLQRLRPRMLKEAVPSEHEEKLASLGLLEHKLGGPVLTVIGKLAAGMLPR